MERIKNTRKHFWNTEKTVPINQLSALAATQDSKAKLRFTYDKENIYNLSCTPYKTRKIERLKLLESNDIEYRYKSVDRSEINLLKAQTEPIDEIIIVKQNRLTDTSLYEHRAIRWLAMDNSFHSFIERNTTCTATRRRQTDRVRSACHRPEIVSIHITHQRYDGFRRTRTVHFKYREPTISQRLTHFRAVV